MRTEEGMEIQGTLADYSSCVMKTSTVDEPQERVRAALRLCQGGELKKELRLRTFRVSERMTYQDTYVTETDRDLPDWMTMWFSDHRLSSPYGDSLKASHDRSRVATSAFAFIGQTLVESIRSCGSICSVAPHVGRIQRCPTESSNDRYFVKLIGYWNSLEHLGPCHSTFKTLVSGLAGQPDFLILRESNESG
ncbi:hypothetical protein STEG23_031455 [Scotinomys teguina]